MFPGAVYLSLISLLLGPVLGPNQEITPLFMLLSLSFWCWGGWRGSLLHVDSSVLHPASQVAPDRAGAGGRRPRIQ